MTARHSPGPWFARRRSARGHNYGVYDMHGALLADVPVHQLANAQTRQRRLADAIAMASASDLILACRALLGNHDALVQARGGTPGVDDRWPEAATFARRVLARVDMQEAS